MADDWASYFCNVNDKLASVFVNLGLAAEAPIASRPRLLWVWVYFRAPRPDGLSDSSEAPTLFLIEDALNLQVGRSCQAIPCGRITTLGRREFYFYGETEEGFDNAVRTVLSGFEGYRSDFGEQEDSQWRHYFDVLYPSRKTLESIKNRDVLEVLQKEGDVHTAAREVQHWMYFRSGALRAAFQDEVAKLGFKIESESQVEGDRPFGISVTRIQPVDQQAIDATVIELVRLIERFDGDYDGWETHVVTQ